MLSSDIKKMFLAGESYVPESDIESMMAYFGKRVDYTKSTKFYSKPKGGLVINPSAIWVGSQSIVETPDHYSKDNQIHGLGYVSCAYYFDGEIYLGFDISISEGNLDRYWSNYEFLNMTSYTDATAKVSDLYMVLAFVKASDKSIEFIGGVTSHLTHLYILLVWGWATC